MTKKGLLVVISSPSGGGKSTVIRKVLASSNGNYRYSVSATTRSRRPNEKLGEDYFFLSHDDFIRMRENNEFVEWAEVHGDLYATPRAHLDRWIQEGRIVLLDVDVDGGLEIKRQYGDDAALIFIQPPSFDSLLERLKERNTESQAQIDKRLARLPKEMDKSKHYDHVVVNDNLDRTVQDIVTIIKSRIN